MIDNHWQIIDKIIEIKSKWLTLIGEKVKDEKGENLDYWRVEKADSLIIITQYQNSLILPKSSYRHGIAEVTLDFAGGRVNPTNKLPDIAYNILQRELNLTQEQIKFITPINHNGFIINSSFSNQKLWGFYCEIKPEISLNNLFIHSVYNLNQKDIKHLLEDLQCLQCRSLLYECLYQGFIQLKLTD